MFIEIDEPNFKSLNEITKNYNAMWYNHYVGYLSKLIYQLFEWENLPDTVDPRFLEKTLHEQGQIAFHKDKSIGFIVLKGTQQGRLNHYGVMDKFNAITVGDMADITTNFHIYHYLNQNENKINPDTRDYGVLIQNNDIATPTMNAVRLFAIDLAEIKSVIRTNVLAQKTPYVMSGNEMNMHTIKNLYNQMESNVPVLFTDKTLELETFNVHLTPAPFVADKLNTQKNAVWNEFMTFIGINNANLEKRERMIQDEATSNNEQIDASGNIMLKARQEACERINWLYPELNVKVRMRTEILDQMMEIGGVQNGNVHNETTGTD